MSLYYDRLNAKRERKARLARTAVLLYALGGFLAVLAPLIAGEVIGALVIASGFLVVAAVGYLIAMGEVR